MIETLKTLNYNKKLIKMLLDARAGAIAVNIVGPVFYFFIFYNTIPLYILILWTLSHFIFFIFRIIVGMHLFKSLKTHTQIEVNQILKKYLIFIFVNSLLWGISTALALKYGSQTQVFIIMAAIFGMITGSMSTLTPIFHAVFIFVFNIIIPFIFSLVLIGANETYYATALFAIIYLTVALPAAYRIHLSMNDSIAKNEEIESLNRELENRVNRAVDETKQKEKLLQEQTRLAQMGEMISMIAHQWRQPLGAISSSVISIQNKKESAVFDLSKEADRDKFLTFSDKKLNNISEYVQTLSSTIDDFRNFFKPDKDKEEVSLALPIQRALSIVETSLSAKNIKITTSIKNEDAVLMYQNEMMQVILNILKNAEDNFLEKTTKEPYINIVCDKKENYYLISIYDNGGGIPKNVLPNIFDPYFSTKDEKNGTGLGLYMSKIMVEEHNNGKLTALNIDGGVCFEISLKKSK